MAPMGEYNIKRTFVLDGELPMPKVSESHKENRREQILAAAGQCFAAKGYDQTSMPEIFRAAGLSAGAVYSYFKSKQEIYLALMAGNLAADLQRYTEVAESGAEPWAKLRSLVELYMAGFADPAQTEFFRLYLTEFLPAGLTNPDLAAPLKERNGRLHALVCRVLREGVLRGAFRPLAEEAVAALVLAAGDGVRLHALAFGSRADARLMFETFITNLELIVRPR